MEKKLLREVRILRTYTIMLTAVLILFTVLAFKKQAANPHFEEIDVERINIVEKSGQLKMVISNKQKQHPGTLNGKELPARERDAGIIFFNSSGDECGGLTYDGNNKGADMTYSIDQFRNDQIMQLNYNEKQQDEKRVNAYGLKLWERPYDMPLEKILQKLDSAKALNNDALYQQTVQQMREKGEFGTERFFAGKTFAGEVGLFIKDSKGRPRIKLYVDQNNTPRIEFLDANGKPVPVK
jgi:hypothetical protein